MCGNCHPTEVILLFDVLSFAALVVAILSILLVLYVENERRQDVAGTVKGLIREEKVRHFGLSEAVVQMVSDGYR